ncbi:MAG TPA: SAM-dependent methyltransferase [Streptosporangiaceae bacterium]|nr:SAM-dependent methyltransferase [Streptosporangiaceae bacterium]
MSQVTSPGNDPARPAAARIYDYLLGGKDNYEVDRTAAERVLAVAPDQRQLARANRAFAIRAVGALASAGVRQFVDLGTGFPTSPSVHEAARQADPEARVVYVDYDSLVHVHNTALLAQDDQVVSVRADVRQPETILGHPDVTRLIDFGQPVGVLCVAVLHLVPDAEDPGGIVARFRDRMCAGSYVVLSQFASDSDAEAMAELRTVAAGTAVETYFRPRDAILRFFDGFELVPPGLTDVERWRQDGAAPTRLKIAGAVGRKP